MDIQDPFDPTKPEPAPIKNDRPAIQDLVIADLRQRTGTAPRAYAGLVAADIEERKAQGLAKYGTLLQAHNGRNAIVDAYQEALDAVQYLKQANEEGAELDFLYERAIELALWLRATLSEDQR
jgi:hypothetical protein